MDQGFVKKIFESYSAHAQFLKSIFSSEIVAYYFVTSALCEEPVLSTS